MASHRTGSSIVQSAGQRLCAAIVASSLILSTGTAHADPPAPAAPAPATTSVATAAAPEGSVWGEGSAATTRKAFVFGALGLAVLAGGIGLGFHINAISKENARQDFIKSNGNTDANPGPGVQEVGPQCKGAVQCAQYSDIKNSRDDSYKMAAGLYGGASAAALAGALFYIQVLVDHGNETRRTGFVPILGPQTAGAAWEARF